MTATTNTGGEVRLCNLKSLFDLTLREMQILDLYVATPRTKEISQSLHLSHKTVETHLYHASIKMGTDGYCKTALAWQQMQMSGLVKQALALKKSYENELDKLVVEHAAITRHRMKG